MLGQNHFAEPNRHVLTFLHPTLICRITYSALLELWKWWDKARGVQV
jgi:hypothetical protein